MYQLKLTYFDFHGGRAEPARLAMILGNIAFEDYRFPFSEFKAVAATTPLRQVPVLEVNGKVVTQCNAISRFVAKLAKLYPEDPYSALLCDELLEAAEDVTHRLVTTFNLEGDALKQARENFVQNTLIHNLRWTESKLAEGDDYFIENRLSIADLKVFVWINSLSSGRFDHIPTNLVEEIAPRLKSHCDRIASIPAIKAYYGS